MYISDEMQDNVDYLNEVISFGNKNGWDVNEPTATWVARYEDE